MIKFLQIILNVFDVRIDEIPTHLFSHFLIWVWSITIKTLKTIRLKFKKKLAKKQAIRRKITTIVFIARNRQERMIVIEQVLFRQIQK